MLGPYDLRTGAKSSGPVIVRGVFFNSAIRPGRALICGCGVVYLPFNNQPPHHCPRLFAVECASADEETAKESMLQLIDDYLTQLADSFTESPTVWNDIVPIAPLEDN
jgi:hypothetical protein